MALTPKNKDTIFDTVPYNKVFESQIANDLHLLPKLVVKKSKILLNKACFQQRSYSTDSFLVKIFLMNVHLFYEYFVRQSVGQATKSIYVLIQKRHFFSTIYNKVLLFFVKIYLMNEHLFCRYFVRVSVGQATKEINAIILKMS